MPELTSSIRRNLQLKCRDMVHETDLDALSKQAFQLVVLHIDRELIRQVFRFPAPHRLSGFSLVSVQIAPTASPLRARHRDRVHVELALSADTPSAATIE